MTLKEAKEIVKAEMRKRGIKISHVTAKEITRCAQQLIDREAST